MDDVMLSLDIVQLTDLNVDRHFLVSNFLVESFFVDFLKKKKLKNKANLKN